MPALIESHFNKYKEKYYTYNVELTMNHLKYKCIGKKYEHIPEEIISVIDIIGCCCLKSNSIEKHHIVYLAIYAYIIAGKQNKKRKKKDITFEVSQKTTFQENLQIAEKWRNLIYFVLYSDHFSSQYYFMKYQYINKGKNDKIVPLYKFNKKILIFINPKSGPGFAYEIYKKKIKPLFSEAEIIEDTIVTSYGNHAYELIQHKDLSVYAGIVVISGDGLLYEIFNGLLQRSDRDRALSTPVGVIPGGSGNGLARSIAHMLNEPYLANPVLISTLNIVNPVATPMDLVIVHTEKGNNLISFLSVGYGIMADIDIESERLRAIGEARFTVYAIARLINLRKYRTRVSYKVATNVQLQEQKLFFNKRRPLVTRSQTMEEAGKNFSFEEMSKNFSFEHQRPSSLCDNNVEETDDIEPIYNLSLQKINEGANGMTNNIVSNVYNKPSCFINNYFGKPLEAQTFGLLDKPVPNEWVTIEDDFVSIYALNQPYMGSEAFISPKSMLDDGIMWLSYIKGNVSKTSILKYLMSIERGTHVDCPGVHYIPVTDLRIEPLSNTGKITIDGELIELGAIQASVVPGKARIMTRRTN